MPRDRVIIVHLRRPNVDLSEKRSDPFWEYGSFGITKCHNKNLMNPKNADKLKGIRFAFAQGGRQGTRLGYLTPPVKIIENRDRIDQPARRQGRGRRRDRRYRCCRRHCQCDLRCHGRAYPPGPVHARTRESGTGRSKLKMKDAAISNDPTSNG